MKALFLKLKDSRRETKSNHEAEAFSQIQSGKAELIAWILFFAVGVAYFVTTLVLATY